MFQIRANSKDSNNYQVLKVLSSRLLFFSFWQVDPSFYLFLYFLRSGRRFFWETDTNSPPSNALIEVEYRCWESCRLKLMSAGQLLYFEEKMTRKVSCSFSYSCNFWSAKWKLAELQRELHFLSLLTHEN